MPDTRNTVESRPVKISLPTADGASIGTESCWATPLGPGRWRVDNVLCFTDGVSRADVVRCDVAGDGTLVAVELLERSDEITVLLHADDPDMLRDVVERLHACDFGGRLSSEGTVGMVALQFPAELDEELWSAAREIVSEVFGVVAELDPEERTLGPVEYDLVTHPEWDAPEPIAGADEVLASRPAPDLVSIDWPAADDAVAGAWPPEVVERLHLRSVDDERLRRMLEDRLYHQVVTLELRFSLIGEYGPARMGRQMWPLGTRPHDGEARDAWLEARVDGRVRYAPDDDADAAFRDGLAALGLDPDADPYVPC